MNDLEKLLDGHPDSTQEFLVGEKQIDGQGSINMDEHGIFCVADKGFDTQILFDFPKEDFDLPAVFVNIGDGFGRESEMVGQKLVMLAAFGIAIANAAQAQHVTFTDNLNDVIRGDAGFSIHRTALQELVNGVPFKAGYEENAFFMEQSEPGVIDIALVEDHDRAFGQLQCLGYTAFMCAGIGNGGKSRNIAIMVKDSVHFDAAFSPAKPGNQ